MKKLFLRDGKLWVGEFPEEPFSYCGCEMCERHKQERFDESVESAKASAVEVVPDWRAVKFDAENQIWWLLDPTQGIYDEMKEGQLYDLPKGWTVEIGYQWKAYENDKWLNTNVYYYNEPNLRYKRQIARLIPSENAQGEIKYMHDRECRRQKDEGVLCQDNCYFKTSGLKECPVKSGIVATGIAEAEQPEALAFLNEDDWTVQESGEKHQYSEGFEWLIKTNELITDASQTLFEDGGVTEEGICLITPHGNIALTVSELRRIIEEVSRPSQVESQESVWKDVEFYCIDHRDQEFDYEEAERRFTITRKTIEP